MMNVALTPLPFLIFHPKSTITPSVLFPQKPKHFVPIFGDGRLKTRSVWDRSRIGSGAKGPVYGRRSAGSVGAPLL
jgi:hypothetical protein